MAKVTITPVEEKKFQPFTLSIQVETEQELAVLTSIFRMNNREILDNCHSDYYSQVVKYLENKTWPFTIVSDVFNALSKKFRRRE